MIKFYYYKKCGTCQKAKRFFDQKKILYKEIDITINPPPKTILKKAIAVYGMKKLFNTSGMEYRKRKIKDKIDFITEPQVLDMLSKNGWLVKRPIAIDASRITLGFNEKEFAIIWNG